MNESPRSESKTQEGLALLLADTTRSDGHGALLDRPPAQLCKKARLLDLIPNGMLFDAGHGSGTEFPSASASLRLLGGVTREATDPVSDPVGDPVDQNNRPIKTALQWAKRGIAHTTPEVTPEVTTEVARAQPESQPESRPEFLELRMMARLAGRAVAEVDGEVR